MSQPAKKSAWRRIGIDLMGSENTPQILLEAAKSLSLPSHFEIVAIGAPSLREEAAPLRFYPADEVIEMDDAPLSAIRKKKKSSLSIGLNLLKEGQIDAFVSAGNTGALVAASRAILSNLPGIDRPALLALLPTKKKPVAVLDVGAGVEASASQLLQFVQMGVAYQQARGISKPTVGLLNIGSEKLKGTSEIRLAYEALQNNQNDSFSFSGNIEGTSVFNGELDVLITDGFTGNVFLKTAEGVASFILDQIHSQIPPKELAQIKPHLSDLHRKIHYAEYPGALLAGVQGIVLKSHGHSTPQGFANTLCSAVELLQKNFLSLER